MVWAPASAGLGTKKNWPDTESRLTPGPLQVPPAGVPGRSRNRAPPRAQRRVGRRGGRARHRPHPDANRVAPAGAVRLTRKDIREQVPANQRDAGRENVAVAVGERNPGAGPHPARRRGIEWHGRVVGATPRGALPGAALRKPFTRISTEATEGQRPFGMR